MAMILILLQYFLERDNVLLCSMDFALLLKNLKHQCFVAREFNYVIKPLALQLYTFLEGYVK